MNDGRHEVPPDGGTSGPSPEPAPADDDFIRAPIPPDPLVDRAAESDPLAPYRPGGATLQADDAMLQPDGPGREFEENFDTGRLQQLPTGQLLIVHRAAPAPAPADIEEEDVQRRVYSWVGAVTGSIGAVASLFVGWMLPLTFVAIIFGVLGLRREESGRTLAFVAIGTGVTGLVFSAVWIGYYAIVYGALPS
ncbi:DUF4190 domain-containing protein [Agromyces sp. LHK192]|uniref:DUF4190 domain-containing protein n=1 Tax=Agromyces sp. LHK192 TaxID=2498704 RepID=UPI000FD8CE8E|nr:DUF4190 domain-containing protein [Agromyces sp. LHK192]